MARVKGGVVSRKRRKRILKLAKGYYGAKHILFRISYSQLMHGLKLAEIEVNRKMLADLAVNDAAAFTALADAAKAKLGK